ncbi:MAG: hypothetical protein GXO31_01990 [Epsilonproteobacteria bacterium]|nr:hypothetical protein [Campylobacterota bacterium]
MTKEEILQFLKDNKSYLQSKFSVEKIGLFGSYAKNKNKEDSDIDFYVILKNRTLDNMTGLWLYLEKKLQRKIDIVYNHPQIRDGLKKEIEQEIIYE